jgi:hypothetical protein
VPLRTLQLVAGVALAAACGARTGLLAPEELDASDVTEHDAKTDRDAAEEDAPVIDEFQPDGPDCPTEATLIYVTGTAGELWSFWPPSFTFTLIGTLTCSDSPTHMTVDRNGIAWVVSSGAIYRASTIDASCSPVSTWTPQTGFGDFSLSFVGLSNTDTSLYLLGDTSLARFDTVAGTFTIVGAPSIPTFGDMTSNGDGTLYFLNDSVPRNLYELSPTNADVLNEYPVASTSTGTQALAYFGALFYLFENDVVYAYDPLTITTTQIGTAPINVTGAGQSTCVPTSPTDASAPD